VDTLRDGRTDMTMLIVAFRVFANGPSSAIINGELVVNNFKI
jgi:hypothetical protein